MGSGTATTYAALAVSGLLLVYLYRRGQGISPLFYVAAFFVYFAFGPVVNHLIGNPIYSGIPTNYIDSAAAGFAVALAGLAAAAIVKRRRPPDALSRHHVGTTYPFLSLTLLALACYGLVMLAQIVPTQLAGATKLGALAAAGPFHYVYLLAQLAAVSTYFIAQRLRSSRRLWMINTAAYVAYCLATSERDFLFALFSILLYKQLASERGRISLSFLTAGAGAVLTAALLFAQRAGERLDFAGVLNQGSLLFVDSYVMQWFEYHGEYRWGQTYLESALSATRLHYTREESLAGWLANTYAPGTDSGYGFSLTAEAYLNFGYIGIFVVFLLLGLLQQTLVRWFGTGDWWNYFAVYATTVILYALRGDSSQLFSALIAGAAFFGVLHVLRVKPEAGHYKRRSVAELESRAQSEQTEASLAPPSKPMGTAEVN